MEEEEKDEGFNFNKAFGYVVLMVLGFFALVFGEKYYRLNYSDVDYTIGEVFHYDSPNSDDSYLYLSYEVNDDTFYLYAPPPSYYGPYYTERILKKYLGKKYLVKFARGKPDLSEVIYDYDLTNSNLMPPLDGWGTMNCFLEAKNTIK